MFFYPADVCHNFRDKFCVECLKKQVINVLDLEWLHQITGKWLNCVAEDDLVGHHWEERTLGLANFICRSTGESQGQEVEVSG